MDPAAFITEWNMPIGNFTLPLRSNFTFNFTVDWGDGSPTAQVTSYNAPEATHEYLTAGAYQISITGTCPGIYVNNGTVKTYLTKVIQWGTVISSFGPMSMFYGCSNLSQLPVGSITITGSVTTAQGMFKNCTGLTSIPIGLFDNCISIGTSGFYETFFGCSGLTSIPTDLFRYNTSNSIMFQNCFYGCSGLTSLPDGLFQYNTGISFNAFVGTFSYCSGLTTLPTDLFRYNINAQFNSTFYGCTGLTSLPVDLFRYNTANTNFASLFYGCTGLTSLPVDLFRYNTSVTTFYAAFQGCSNLQTVSADLFRYNTSVTTFYSVFRDCIKLQFREDMFFASGEESTRFLNKSVDFRYSFNRSSFSGTIGFAPALWACDYGTGTANNANAFTGNGNNEASISNYCSIPLVWGGVHCARLESIGAAWYSETQEKISVTTTMEIPAGDTFLCYVSTSEVGLIDPANLFPLVQVTPTLYEAIATVPGDAVIYYVHIDYSEPGGLNPEALDYSSKHYQIQDIPTSNINIPTPDRHITFVNPLTPHKLNHGLLFYDGYIYGSSRNWFEIGGGIFSSASIFKVKADDYSLIAQNTFYNNQSVPASSEIMSTIDQIIEYSGFLWAQAEYYGMGFLIRIAPADLSYMIFKIDTATHGQPIETDGVYLYVTTNSDVQKIDGSLLLDAAANYGYNNTTPVALPINSILGSCPIIQYHIDTGLPADFVYSHSIQIDDEYIYLAITTGGYPNGYDSAADVYQYHLQKVAKNTMVTANDVIIPKCTDDMVQNAEYLFLCPEYSDSAISIYGETWGLLAINKSTLGIKYLKALSKEFDTGNESDRAGYGVFLLNNHLVVQLATSQKTVVVDISEVDQWGETFPIGGATKAIYNFSIEGIPITLPANELVLDGSGWVHVNTWGEETQLFKFQLSEFTPIIQSFNSLSLSYLNAAALLETIASNYGCSIRCVQDAPGVADGVTGTATDQDGNEYQTVVINQKRWFVENLKAKHYRNGDPVPEVTDPGAWAALADGGHAAYDNKASNV